MNDLSLHILDIIQNSISAGATLISLSVCEDYDGDILTISIVDNGDGMTKEMLSKAVDPFFSSRTTRRVGLGLSLFKQSAEECGGRFDINSKEGFGTVVIATYCYSHIDRPPIGNVANTFALMVSCNPDICFELKYTKGCRSYVLSTTDIKDALGDIPITNALVVSAVEQIIENNI